VVEDIAAELRATWALAPDAVADLIDTRRDDLAGEHRADLLLAWACLGGSPAALAELDRSALEPARVHARASGLPPVTVDEAVQIARMRLAVADGDRPPGLRAYRGRGSLAAFVRTAVLRVAIDLVRRDRETPDGHIDAMLAAAHPDPELEYMRRQYADTLGNALRAAWRELPPHDRFVLGLQVHEKLDLDAIAKIYQVHRATAARRAASARAALIGLVRAAIRRELAIGDATVDSILRVVTTSTAWAALEHGVSRTH
jgi:RNA polymerase sigma-70 factor (ECF subfamily)